MLHVSRDYDMINLQARSWRVEPIDRYLSACSEYVYKIRYCRQGGQRASKPVISSLIKVVQPPCSDEATLPCGLGGLRKEANIDTKKRIPA